jgi:hypothetical protein
MANPLFSFDFYLNKCVEVAETGGELEPFLEAIWRVHGQTDEAVNFCLNLKVATEAQSEPPFCQGHVALIAGLEYFFVGDQLYRARFSNPLDIDGYRNGARWQCPRHMAESYLQQVRAAC